MSREAAELAREGEYWTIVFGAHEVRMRDSKGLAHLAELLANPGDEIEALQLAGGRAGGLAPDAAADTGPLLDSAARRAYRKRLGELRVEIEQADAFHDVERAARARIEADTLVEQLSAATGLAGRDRRTGSAAERARLNVSRAIRSAIARIGEHAPALAEHLDASVQTGRRCVYRPVSAVSWTVTTGGARRLGVGAASAPETRYARSGDVSLAYQVLGDGPDLVFVPGFMSHIDMQWAFPAAARFFRRLAGFSRLILYDKRDQGLSDRPAGVPTLEDDMDDLRAILDAAGSERAVLFGYSEGGPMSALFAAGHPDRVAALVLSASFASGRRWLDRSGELDERVCDMLEHWGEGRALDVFAPSAAGPAQVRRFGAFERAVGSPAAMRARWRACGEIDITAVLDAIGVPTLVVHRAGELTVPAELGRELARSIPRARYVEVPGVDHIPWAGDAEPILEAVEGFVAGPPGARAADRVLTTVAFIDAEPALARIEVDRFRGNEVGPTAAGLLVTFDGPARAVQCARAIVRRGGASAGLHTGECSVGAEGIGGIAVDIGARVAALAAPGEVLVSGTVRDLVVGSDIPFEDRGIHELAGVPGEWRVLRSPTE
jgi:pimeloyl-ACP methyl ester carboxylesterase